MSIKVEGRDCGRWLRSKERQSLELTFRLSINTEEEPAMGEADTAFQAEGTAYIKALR